ncbi:DUF397 domain-containing protein [Streptomyces sp. NPDC050523]|uniref:DUF397 domain-containing protein n=1 Tax=Streptomyces sp. NPDC050523 TaxID=3365622 RepID=UPI003791EBE2
MANRPERSSRRYGSPSWHQTVLRSAPGTDRRVGSARVRIGDLDAGVPAPAWSITFVSNSVAHTRTSKPSARRCLPPVARSAQGRRVVAGRVPVRDSKDPDGPAALITAAAWAPFVGALRS